MPSIRFSRTSFGYDDVRPLFSEFDLALEPGWHGLVGANGAGKSTLLSLVTGAIAPSRGLVVTTPDWLRITWVPQETATRTPALDALASRSDRSSARWCASLGVIREGLARWESLSPGERMRAHLAAALVDEPDVLLLDEPTNHVDAEARELAREALAGFRGIGLVVSHDRAFLDALCSRTIWLEDGKVREYRGGYTAARDARELERRAALGAREAAKAEVARLSRSVDALKRSREAAESTISTKRRQRSPKDSDARGLLAKTRVQWAEARLGRSVSTHGEHLARAKESLAALGPVKDERGRTITFEPTTSGPPIVVALDGVDVVAGTTTVLRDVHLTLRRGERVWLRGENGAGKTSLMRAIVGARSRPRAFYLPQELDEATVRDHQATLRSLAPDARGRAFQRLAALGCDPSIVVASSQPSCGEARKLALAAGLARPLEVILMDEPTNHLDLPSIERLENALASFPGALIVVSHDERFASALCTRTWTIAEGEVR